MGIIAITKRVVRIEDASHASYSDYPIKLFGRNYRIEFFNKE